MAQLQRLTITPQQLQDGHLTLSDEQSHYLGRVLRLRPPDQFIALNGQGQSWLAELISSSQARCIQTVELQAELPLAVTLLLAIPKGNGLDEVVRQATELGVSGIIPVISDRTLVQPSGNRVERWRRIAQEAAEQCERAIVPTIQEPLPLIKLLESGHATTMDTAASRRYFCVTRHPAPHLLNCLETDQPTQLTLAIGPEGGWTDREVTAAIATGYQPVSLGQRILRAVTAPLVALSLIAAMAERQIER